MKKKVLKRFWKKSIDLLLIAFFFFLPFRVRFLFYSGGGGAFFNPYLSEWIYLGDILLILLVAVFLFGWIYFDLKLNLDVGRRKILYFVFLICVASFLSLLWAVDFWNSLFFALRIFLFCGLVFVLGSREFDLNRYLKIFLFALSVVALLGILQFIYQRSFGLHFFGEEFLNPDIKGLAKVAFGESNLLRAYGTFPHPNVFAGYLGAGILISWRLFKESARRIWFVVMIFLFMPFLLTFSRAGLLALVLSFIFLWGVEGIRVNFKYLALLGFILIAFAFIFNLASLWSYRVFVGDMQSALERLRFADISLKMFFDNIFGVGGGNFTALMQNYSHSKLEPWQFQPVHNIILLALNELGILGFFAILFAFLASFFRKYSLHFLRALVLFLFVVGLFDHYLFSLYQGQALLFTSFGLALYYR